MLLSLTPTGATEYVVIDEDATSEPHGFVLQAQDWGNAAWEHQFSGPRGTQGARPSQGTPANRTVRLQFRLYATSTDDLAARIAEIEMVIEALRRRGGTITRRAHGQTYRQHFEVLTTNGLQAGEWSPVADTRYILSPILEFVCAPYVLGDPMAWTDDAAQTLANTAVVAGAGTPAVSGDLLAVAATGAHLLVDTRRGYRYGDVQVSARIWPGSTSAGTRRWGVLLRYVDADNWLAVTLEQDPGSVGVLRIRSCVAGSESVLAGDSSLADDLTGYAVDGGWIVGRIDGAAVQAQWQPRAYAPTSPWVSTDGLTSAALTGTHLAAWGPGTEGHVGLYAVPQDTSGVGGWHTVQVQPMVMAGNGVPQMHRHAFPLRCTIPGTAPALADVAVARDNESTGGAPRFALLGWASHRSGRNRCTNGVFSLFTGWSLEAPVGLAVAAQEAASASSPDAGASVTGVASTDLSGIEYPFGGEFIAGHTYRARCQMRSLDGAVSCDIALGEPGDHAESATVALTSDWQTITVDWTPTGNIYAGAAVAIRRRVPPDTTNRVFRVRRVEVFEAADEPTIPSQQDGYGAGSPLGIYALGSDGFTAASSAGGTLSGTASGVSTLVPASVQVAVTGAGYLAVSALIDPNLVGGDDYADGSLDVEVWLRAAASSTLISPRCAVWAGHPDSAYDTDELGGRRVIAPWGLGGKPLANPGFWRLYRIGVLSLDVNPGNMAPWRVTARISWAAGSTGAANISALILTPARSRALTPTGVVLSEGGYPSFIGAAGGDFRIIVKRISSTGEGSVSAPPLPGAFADHGLGGSMLELPTGRVDMLAVFADQVPDDPTPAAAHVGHPSHLAIAVSPTPRWGHLRDI